MKKKKKNPLLSSCLIPLLPFMVIEMVCDVVMKG